VVPLDYGVHGHDVVIRVGEGLFKRLEHQLVAFQVDGVTDPTITEGAEPKHLWSVLLQGLAIEGDGGVSKRDEPQPQVPLPGRRVVRIRADVITGRRFPVARES
jgi:hypothetical protein